MKTSAVARGRRLAARALVAGPALAIVALDVALRGSLLRAFTRDAALAYLACAAPGAVAWGALVVAAARRRGGSRWAARALVAAAALFAVGTQLATWARYGAYLNWRTALMGNSLWPALMQELWRDRLRVAFLQAAPVAAALAMVVVARRLAPPRRRAARAALPLGVLALAAAAALGKPDAGWDSGTTPDVLWLSALGALARSKHTHEDIMVELPALPAERSPEALPALHAAPPRRRDVLLVVGESMRADDVCSVPRPDAECTRNPFTNALLPHRFGFTQMRALDSTTVLSVAVLLGGVPPSDDRARLLSAPLLPEYAHAAGVDAAYWTSQNLLFANFGRFLDGLPLSAQVNGTELAPYATYETGGDDGVMLSRALADLPRLREPYFAVVQLANTHFPYVVDEHDLPFSSTVDWRHMDNAGRARVRYWDALHRQDELLARFVAAVRARPGGERTVIVFLSDHGEQLGEHGHIGHTFSPYDVEIHVPMWIDAPPGTLTDAEAAHLAALRDAPRTMLDVAPTLLDLIGVWDDPSMAGWRARMRGESLLRGGSPADRAVVLTNCSSIYSCGTRNWGALRGTRKLVGTEEEGDTPGAWRCFDVATDPAERRDLGAGACGDLRSLAEGGGRGTPFGP